jgi:hypothetical protein
MQKPIIAVDSLSSLDLYLGYCDEEYDDDVDDDHDCKAVMMLLTIEVIEMIMMVMFVMMKQ